MRNMHKMAPRAAFLVVPTLMALLVGCAPSSQPSTGQQAGGGEQAKGAGQPKSGGILNLLANQAGDPPSFDLHRESTSATTEAAGPSYDNLVRFDPMDPMDAKILPDLAEKWTVSPDGKTFTFNLRKGVKFHNGDPFTAADVKFTLDRVMNPPKGMVSPRQTAFEPIKNIATPDDFTVIITTERPYASLMVNLAQGWMGMYDKKWIEAKDNDRPKLEMMGTGPFILDKYTRGTEILRKKNPTYWNTGKPYLDSVRHLIVPDPNTRVAAFRTGQVDSFAASASEFESLQKELGDKVRAESYGSLGFGTLYMNWKKKPFDDQRVREAINLVVNRQDAVKVVTQGDAFLGGNMRPGGPWSLSDEEILKLPGYRADKTPDIAKAKQLMADAGYPNGFASAYITRSSQSYIDLTVFLQDQLKKIGITGEMKTYETAQVYDLANKGEFDMMPWSHGFALDDPDAVYNEFYLCNSPRNYSRACVPQVDELFNKQSQELDPAKRKDLMMQLEKLAVPQNIKITAYWSKGRSLKWNYVMDYVSHASGYNNIRFDAVWLDK